MSTKTKKKTPKKTKRCICNSPRPKTVDFAELDYGDCFLWNGLIFTKTSYFNNPAGVCLEDGEVTSWMCGEQVTPVTNVKITYDLA